MLLKEKKEIETWLKKYRIINYELILDEEYGYIINVNGNVDLWHKKLKSIDVKFGKINGNFNCSYNKLKTLKGCPEIVEGSFHCSTNELESLESCPKIIIGDIYFFGNLLKIEGLKYLPEKNESNYVEIFNNEKIGELQKITELKELKEKVKEILKIKEEKKDLLNIINKNSKKVVVKNFNKI